MRVSRKAALAVYWIGRSLELEESLTTFIALRDEGIVDWDGELEGCGETEGSGKDDFVEAGNCFRAFDRQEFPHESIIEIH